MTNMVLRQTTRMLPLAAVLVLPLLVGAVVVWAGWLGAVAVLGAAVACLALSMLRGTAVYTAALALCAAIITYPAFLPRPESVSGTFVGEASSSRAQIHLLIVLAIMAAAGLAWLSTPGSIAVLTRAPFNLFACYSGIIVLSFAYTPDKTWSLFAVLKLFGAFLVVATLGVLVKRLDQLRRVVNVMLGAIAFVMLMFWFDVLTGSTVQDLTNRVTATWLHPNSASVMAFTFTSMMAARFFTASSRRSVRNAAILACLGALTGLVTGGKTALVGSVAAVGLTVAVMMTRRVRYSRTGRLLLMGCGLAVVTGYVVVNNIGVVAHLQAYNENAYLDPTQLTGRVPLWGVAFRMAMETPFLGHGYMSSFAIGFDNGLGWRTYQTHNSFLQTFFDLGLVGLIVVVLIYGTTWYTALRQSIGHHVSDGHWQLSVELLAALTVLTLNSFAEDVFGGIFEIRTMLFIVVVFAIHQNAYISRLGSTTRT